MKVTVENIKGLNKDIKVFIDKKTMNSYMDEKYEEIKNTVNLKGLDQEKFQKKFLKDNLAKQFLAKSLIKFLKIHQLKL